MKKRLFGLILAAAFCVLFFAGCANRIDYSLPSNPTAFNTGTFVNPNDEDDAYQSIEYNGRTYVCYGTIKGKLDGNDVGECLGYIVQDGVKDENARVFKLTDDADGNYLVNIYVGGIMDQPIFYRAVDTAGKDIYTPKYIYDLGYDFWR